MSEVPNLYTLESIVFRSGLDSLDNRKLAVPVTVYEDSAGNHALVHGNHRAFYFSSFGQLDRLEREVIGHLKKDVSEDPYYRHVNELRVIEK